MVLYKCARCEHEADHKSHMYNHLYKRKKKCTEKNPVDLTDEIKQYILDNGTWHPPPVGNLSTATSLTNCHNTINNTLNNNIINNFIINSNLNAKLLRQIQAVSVDNKLSALLKYGGKQLISFEDGLDQRFEKLVDRLDHDKHNQPLHRLKAEDFVKLVDQVTLADPNRMEQLNVWFDQEVSKLHLYRSEQQWELYLNLEGIKEIVQLLHSYYLYHYELYLIRNLHKDDRQHSHSNFELNQALNDLYTFCSYFRIEPAINGVSDKILLGHRLLESTDSYLEDRYTKLYSEILNKTRESDRKQMHRQLGNIIRNNTVHNISELNNQVVKMLGESYLNPDPTELNNLLNILSDTPTGLLNFKKKYMALNQ